MVTAPRPLRSPRPPVRYYWGKPTWRWFTRDFYRGRHLAVRRAWELANDPEHIARVNKLIADHRAGKYKTELTFNDIRVRYGMRDPNPFPKMNLLKGWWR